MVHLIRLYTYIYICTEIGAINDIFHTAMYIYIHVQRWGYSMIHLILLCINIYIYTEMGVLNDRVEFISLYTNIK